MSAQKTNNHELLVLYAEIQANPRSTAAYRKLVELFRKAEMTNEAEAFLQLLKEKFHASGPPLDPEQCHNPQSSP